MKKISLFTLLVVLASLVACDRQVSHEVIYFQTTSDVYKRFIDDPQSIQPQLTQYYHQDIPKLLQGILLSQNKPSEATISAFSQLFADAYVKATDHRLSESENVNHASILGFIVGYLTALQDYIDQQRRSHLITWWYDYSEIDKRWLGLFTDIAPLTLSHNLDKKTLEIAQTGAVNDFIEALMQSNFAKRNTKNLVYRMIDDTTDAIRPRFNGYSKDTSRKIRLAYSALFVEGYRTRINIKL
jgi:hypothetical protein